MALSRRELLAIAGAAVPAACLAAGTADPADDIAIVRHAYEALHPGLYRYSTPSDVAARFDRLDRDWRGTVSIQARYLLLSRFLGSVRCGHSYANFYNQSRFVQEALFGRADRLPFHFRWLGDQMVVTRDPAAIGLPPGTRILAIDGRAPADILHALLPFARADGSNDAKRRMLMSIQAIDGYETFDIFYPLLFPVGDRFAVSARLPDGRARSLSVAPFTLSQRRAQRPAEPDNAADAPIWTSRIDGRTAVLDMPSWALYNSKWDWRSWLDARFEDYGAQGVSALIIDLRRNEGGEDCGTEIIARRIATAIPFSDERRLVRYRRVPDDLIPVLDTWDKSFRTLGEDAEPAGPGWYALKDQDDGLIRPKSRFTGKLIVLIGPENSSATFQFANLVKQQKLGVLVGEPTGGNRRGINGGCFFFLRLPGSGLEADLPLVGRFPRTPQPDAGVEPDVSVLLTAIDIASGRDPAMARALALARA